jgi:DNA-binding IscR family transcriptional regulator
LQNAGHELIEMGSKQPNSDEGKQDIALGQMMRKAKDAIKDEFARITMGKW